MGTFNKIRNFILNVVTYAVTFLFLICACGLDDSENLNRLLTVMLCCFAFLFLRALADEWFYKED